MNAQHDDPAGRPMQPMRAGSALPTDPAERLVALDVLRGVAVLGILLINVYGWAFPDFAMVYQPFAFGSALPVDRWTWAVEQVFVEGAMRALFSLLFGAGVVLLTGRLETRARVDPAVIHYRRTLWLIVFGLLHAYVLLWNGDILYVYGVVGLALYPLRKLSPGMLIAAAVLCFGVSLGSSFVDELQLDQRERAVDAALQQQARGQAISAEQQHAIDAWNEEIDEYWAIDDDIQRELEWRRSNYGAVFVHLAPHNLRAQTVALLRWNLWDAAGPMLLGMALMKLGVLSGLLSSRRYVALMIAGYAIGLPVNVVEAMAEYRSALGEDVSIRFVYYTYDLGRVMTMLGHVGVIMLLVRAGIIARLQRALAACGRMALTNYIIQSVICGLLFYGFGYGLVGRLGRFDCLAVVAGTWVLQLTWSPLWLARFRYGPLEWLWRSLTYQQRVPMLRTM